MNENLVSNYIDNVKENTGAHIATAVLAVTIDRTFDVVGKTKKVIAGSKVAQTLATQFNRSKSQVNQAEVMVNTMEEMTEALKRMGNNQKTQQAATDAVLDSMHQMTESMNELTGNAAAATTPPAAQAPSQAVNKK